MESRSTVPGSRCVDEVKRSYCKTNSFRSFSKNNSTISKRRASPILLEMKFRFLKMFFYSSRNYFNNIFGLIFRKSFLKVPQISSTSRLQYPNVFFGMHLWHPMRMSQKNKELLRDFFFLNSSKELIEKFEEILPSI